MEGFQRRLNSDLSLRTLRGLCKAEALRFIISQVSLDTQLPTAVCALSWQDVARLIQDNSLVNDTQVVVSGTWTKPRNQWDGVPSCKAFGKRISH